MKNSKTDRLKELLLPLVHEEKSRIDSFLLEDVDWYIKCVEAFQVEDKVIAYVRAHPNASAQELYHLIPEGVPPGQEDILDDTEEDE